KIYAALTWDRRSAAACSGQRARINSITSSPRAMFQRAITDAAFGAASEVTPRFIDLLPPLPLGSGAISDGRATRHRNVDVVFRFAGDSPLEQSGFELSVPLALKLVVSRKRELDGGILVGADEGMIP